MFIESEIKPTVVSICEVKARVIASSVINETIKEELNSNNLKEQVLNPVYDKDGKLIMIKTDALLMNTISSNIAKNVQDKIINLEEQSFSIPLLTALNSQLLSDYGPILRFSISHQGSVLVDFKTEFAESGINQTRYKIYISVNVNIRVFSPVNTSSTNVTNDVLIAEVVIIGDVPNSYMSIPSIGK